MTASYRPDWDHEDSAYTTSSACHGAGNCVEVHQLDDAGIVLRDAFRSTVTYSADEWDAFLAGAKAGEFDRDALARRFSDGC